MRLQPWPTHWLQPCETLSRFLTHTNFELKGHQAIMLVVVCYTALDDSSTCPGPIRPVEISTDIQRLGEKKGWAIYSCFQLFPRCPSIRGPPLCQWLCLIATASIRLSLFTLCPCRLKDWKSFLKQGRALHHSLSFSLNSMHTFVQFPFGKLC